MNIEKVKKTFRERKSIGISVRTYPKYSKWLRDNEVSPTALFNEAVKELIENEN